MQRHWKVLQDPGADAGAFVKSHVHAQWPLWVMCGGFLRCRQVGFFKVVHFPKNFNALVLDWLVLGVENEIGIAAIFKGASQL